MIKLCLLLSIVVCMLGCSGKKTINLINDNGHSYVEGAMAKLLFPIGGIFLNAEVKTKPLQESYLKLDINDVYGERCNLIFMEVEKEKEHRNFYETDLEYYIKVLSRSYLADRSNVMILNANRCISIKDTYPKHGGENGSIIYCDAASDTYFVAILSGTSKCHDEHVSLFYSLARKIQF